MTYQTSDQYLGISKLEKWYRKYNHQIIEISAVVGTGVWDIIQTFISNEEFDPREIMYLSFNQKQVLELAAKRYHAYYINGIIYNYNRIVDFNSIPVINSHSNELKYTWKKEVRKKIDSKYKLIVVFDSVLLNESTLNDLCTFGLPIILIRDPMLLPAPDSYTFSRDANIILREPHPDYIRNPINYFAHKTIIENKFIPGNYDNVSIVPRKQMNLYNLKSSDMNITLTDSLRNEINHIYREKILKRKDSINIVNERMIVTNDMYSHRIVNQDEKKIKIYLRKGVVGNITKINRHVEVTKYVPIEFRPEFYFESFDDLVLDRYHLNGVVANSRQMIPDEIIQMEYAYALTPQLARLGHWDKVTIIMDQYNDDDIELQKRLMYTAITRAKRSVTIII